MNDRTITLEKTRRLIPLVRELWPYHGMGFTYVIDPPTDLHTTRHRFSGILKRFKADGTIVTVNRDTSNSLTRRLKVFVSVPGRKRDEAYYQQIAAHLQASLCTPVAQQPAKFEDILRSLIE
jgi:hypothetical protein